MCSQPDPDFEDVEETPQEEADGVQEATQDEEVFYLTVDEAADLIGIDARSVRRRIVAGTLNAEKDGRSWRIALTESEQDELKRQRASRDGSESTAGRGSGSKESGLSHVEPIDADSISALVNFMSDLEMDKTELVAELAVTKERLRVANETIKDLKAQLDAPIALPAPQPEPAGVEPAPASRPWWKVFLGIE